MFNSVKNILSTNTAYKWVSTEEPFINNYGKLCFDYSGEVVKMSCDEYHTIINSDSVISDILSDLHVNRSYIHLKLRKALGKLFRFNNRTHRRLH